MQQLEARIRAWAETQPNIRAIIVIGSKARRDGTDDELSDLDMILFTADTSEYAASADWLNDIGEVSAAIPWETGGGHLEYLVMFDGYNKADFAFFPLEELKRPVETQSLPNVYHRGYYALVDKDGLAAQWPPPPFAPPPRKKPSAESFQRVATSFWYKAYQTAKYLHRNDLWAAKQREGRLKEDLLTMIEWRSRAVKGWDYDTWHEGRFMSRWVEPQIWGTLHAVFGHFDAADSWRALRVTMDLFRRLTRETAEHLGYGYPAELDGLMTQFVERLQPD